MYNPFDRPPGEEVVEAIPRDRSRSPSRSRSDRRPRKSARWLVVLHVVSVSRVAHMGTCLHVCLAQSWGGAHQFG